MCIKMTECFSDGELTELRGVDIKTHTKVLDRWAVVRRASIGWFHNKRRNLLTNCVDGLSEQEFVVALTSPSVHLYASLKRKLACTEPEWILHFLHHHGLEILLESLEQICSHRSTTFLDVILQIECVECVRTIMDSSMGLDYIVENKEFTRKLAAALDTENVTVKTQVFQLLSALCAYSSEGHDRAIDALESFKVAKKQRYRFSLLPDELRKTESVSYKTTLIECINCIVIYTEKIEDRARIRNEFLGLKLQVVLNNLRVQDDQDTNLLVQLDVFDGQRAIDEEELPGAKGVDLNSPLDVFHAIYKQICDTPVEFHFLSSLQYMLKIDPDDVNSDIIWQTIEQLICKSTLIESVEDSHKLLLVTDKKRDKSIDGKCCCACHKDDDKNRISQRRRSSSHNMTGSTATTPEGVPSSISTRLTSPNSTAPPPPPAIPGPGNSVPPPPPSIPVFYEPPPPPPPFNMAPPAPPGARPMPPNTLQLKIPKPKTKMRSFQWQKLSANKIHTGRPNIWTVAGNIFNVYMNKLDFGQIEELFSVSQPSKLQGKGSTENNSLERKKKENTEINLLDGKRSLNSNIVLKQFRMSNEEIVRFLRDGNSEKFGSEKLNGLLKILPDQDEIDELRHFSGDREKLGNAEKFFLCLLGLPHYRVRIEGMLLRKEFDSNMEWIRPSIDAVIEAAKDIKANKALHELIYLVLIAGNYLNAGNYAGDAAGFKMSSLLKLTEMRANKPRMNLMHFVVMQANEKNPSLLQFPDQLQFLKDASQVSIENLKTDICSLDTKLNNISSHIGRMGDDFKGQMVVFLKEAKTDILELKEDLKDIESLRLELADFFCEEPAAFKMEESFKTLQTFCERFKKAIQENTQRKIQEEKVEARRKQREDELKAKQQDDMMSPQDQTMQRGGNREEGSIVERLLADVRSGFTNRQYGESNFSVTKVQKVQLDTTDGSVPNADAQPNADVLLGEFVREGYGRLSTKRRSRRSRGQSEKTNQSVVDSADSESTCSSLEDTDFSNQKRTRRSYADDSEDNLIDFLMASGEELPEHMTGNFERVGSLRRRRQERRDTRSILDSTVFDRERAASPRLNQDDIYRDSAKARIHMKTKEMYERAERPKSDVFDDVVGLKRTRHTMSKLDKLPVQRVVSLTDSSSTTDKDKEQSLARTRTKLYRSFREKSRPSDRPLTREGLDLSGDKSPEFSSEKSSDSMEIQSTRTRWRVGVSCASPEPHNLQTIDEKSRLETPTRELNEKQDVDINSNNVEKYVENPKELLAKRISRTSIDHTELTRMLNSVNVQNGNTVDDNDGHRVSVSVRSKLNRRWHSDLGKADIDQVLKAIEDTGKPIESAGVPTNINTSKTCDISSDIKVNINSDVDENKMNDFENSSVSDEGEALKERRSKRKQRSYLDMDDVHKALVQVKSEATANTGLSKTSSDTVSSKTAKSPASKRRSASHGEEVNRTSSDKPRKERDTKEMSKAAKLAAKRRFRAERFGDKDTMTQKALMDHATGRWKSNVEKDDVDRALKDMVSKGNMSRSKSYDESVARLALGENGEFSLVGRNSGSNPDTHSEVRAIMRNSTSKLSSDPRRYGTYIPSDESENELLSDSASFRRPSSSSKSCSPKSSCRLSIKSTNTSTETLRDELPSESESSPEQRRKNAEKTDDSNTEVLQANSLFPRSSTFSGRLQNGDSTNPVAPSRSKRSSMEIGNTETMFDSKVVVDENDDSHAAMLTKWKMKRMSQYDNVTDNDASHSPRTKLTNEPFRYDVCTTGPRTDQPVNMATAIIHKCEGSGDIRNDIGSRCSNASSSDSARDEGFDSMSGTVSQRTSMSSTLESELTPKLSRKIIENMKPISDKTTLIREIIPQHGEIIVAHAQSVKELKKQRTESWTQYTVIANANVNQDSSLDTSAEYSSTTPDSGHETMKDEWTGQSDIESTLTCKSPHSEHSSDSKHESETKELLKVSDDISRNKKHLPSYMRGTSSSTGRVKPTSIDDIDTRQRSASTKTPPVHLVKHRISHDGIKSRAESNSSLVSTASSMTEVNDRSPFSKTPSKRKISGSSTPHSRPSTPQSRPTTPMSTASSRSTTPLTHSPTPTNGLTRTQSLRIHNSTRPSLGSTTDQKSKKPAPPRPSSLTTSPHSRSSLRRSFMDPTTSSSTRIRSETSSPTPPLPPPRTSSQKLIASPRVPGRSRDDLIVDKSKPSPLTRHSSLRLTATAAAKITGREANLSEKEKCPSEKKVRSFMNKLSGSKSPEKVNKRESIGVKLATVRELNDSDADNADKLKDNYNSEKDKSQSFLKRIVSKTKEKSPQKKTTEAGKAESPRKKITK